MGKKLDKLTSYWNNNIEKNTTYVSKSFGAFLVSALWLLAGPFNAWISNVATIDWIDPLKGIYTGFALFMSVLIFAIFGKQNGNGD